MGSVNPCFSANSGARLERGIQGQIEIGRIAGQPGEEEHETDQAQQRDQAVQTAPGEILPQRPSPGSPDPQVVRAVGSRRVRRWRIHLCAPTMPRPSAAIKDWYGDPCRGSRLSVRCVVVWAPADSQSLQQSKGTQP
jgi:hypothetical protein